jgi:chromate transporter
MALIAMVRDKLVTRDNRLDDDTLSQGIAIASLLPGPVAVNVVAFVGYSLRGWRGAVVSIVAVLLPSFLMVLVIAILYFNYNSVYSFRLLMTGIIPVVVATIASVGVSMGKKNCKQMHQWMIVAVSVLVLLLFSGYWIAMGVLIGASGVGIWVNRRNLLKTKESAKKQPIAGWAILVLIALTFSIQYISLDMIGARLFILFSSLSLTLFGGGYVMVPLLKTLIVDQNAWVSYEEFAFGISVGQVTPGPILISAAFFGYKVFGIKGAILSTFGIFLPSSALMILVSQIFQRFKESTWLKAALEGILPAVVGLIIFSGFSLFKNHIQDYSFLLAFLILVISFVLVYRFQRTPPLVLVIGIGLAYVFNIILA